MKISKVTDYAALRVCNLFFFLIFQPNMLWMFKRTISMRVSIGFTDKGIMALKFTDSRIMAIKFND